MYGHNHLHVVYILSLSFYHESILCRSNLKIQHILTTMFPEL